MKPMMSLSWARVSRRPLVASAVVATAVLLAACGGSKDKAASQTAARVNKDEVTVHQINFVLQQQRGLRPEQTEAVSRQALERLIDQQLALQKADDLKLDRDPRVQQQLEFARREVISRAYIERVSEAAAKPTPDEVRKFYDDKPALFAQRRIYNLQEIAIEAKAEQAATLRAKLSDAKNINEFIEYLKANEIRFAGNQAVRAAEQLPPQSLVSISQMNDGQAMFLTGPTGFQVVILAGSRPQPVTLEQATPAIEAQLLNERKRKLAEDDIKALRAAAKIEYVGKFAEAAASAPAAASAAQPAKSASDAEAAAISQGLGLKK